MSQYLTCLMQLKSDRRAVTALEYGLIAALIAGAIIAAITLFGTDLAGLFGGMSAKVSGTTAGIK